MGIEKVEFGIHTIELYAGHLKYVEAQKIIDHLAAEKSIFSTKSDPYHIDRHLKSTYLASDGIRLHIHQSHDKSSGIGFIVNPSTLLKTKYQPTKLYKPTKKLPYADRKAGKCHVCPTYDQSFRLLCGGTGAYGCRLI